MQKFIKFHKKDPPGLPKTEAEGLYKHWNIWIHRGHNKPLLSSFQFCPGDLLEVKVDGDTGHSIIPLIAYRGMCAKKLTDAPKTQCPPLHKTCHIKSPTQFSFQFHTHLIHKNNYTHTLYIYIDKWIFLLSRSFPSAIMKVSRQCLDVSDNMSLGTSWCACISRQCLDVSILCLDIASYI